MSQSSQERLPPPGGSLEIHPRKVFGLGLIFKSMLGRFWQRSILALVLMIAQSFLYNSVFFSSPLRFSEKIEAGVSCASVRRPSRALTPLPVSLTMLCYEAHLGAP
jgi:hypothetical protein